MTFPPGAYPLRSNFVNSDPMHDDHPTHHDNLADALNEVVQWGEAEFQRMLMQVPLRARGVMEGSTEYGVGDVVQRANTDDVSFAQRTYVCITDGALGSSLDNTDNWREIDTLHWDNTYVRSGTPSSGIAQPLFFISQIHPNQLNGGGFESSCTISNAATGGTYDLTVNFNNEGVNPFLGSNTVTVPFDASGPDIAKLLIDADNILRFGMPFEDTFVVSSSGSPGSIITNIGFDPYCGNVVMTVDDTNATGGSVTVGSVNVGWAPGLDAPLGSLCLVQGVTLSDGDLFIKNGLYPWSWSEWPGGRPLSMGLYYQGDWRTGHHYLPGDCVTYNNTAWAAQRETAFEEPNAGAGTPGSSAWAPLTYGDFPAPLTIAGTVTPRARSQKFYLQLAGASSGVVTLVIDSGFQTYDVLKTVTFNWNDDNTAIAAAFNASIGVTPSITGTDLASGITVDTGKDNTLAFLVAETSGDGSLVANWDDPTDSGLTGFPDLTAPNSSIYLQQFSDGSGSDRVYYRQDGRWYLQSYTRLSPSSLSMAQSGASIDASNQYILESWRQGSDTFAAMDIRGQFVFTTVSGSPTGDITGSIAPVMYESVAGGSDATHLAGLLMAPSTNALLFWNGTLGGTDAVGMIRPALDGTFTLLDMAGNPVIATLTSGDDIIITGTIWFGSD